MRREEGKFKIEIALDPGNWEYKFIVDGRWTTDPDNENWEENEYGTGNSVIWFEP